LSSALIIQTPDQIFIGSDSAVSTKLNGKTYRVKDEHGKKLYEIDDMIIFCSGNMALSEQIMSVFSTSINKTLTNLKNISQFLFNTFDNKDDTSFPVDILVAKFENEVSVVYQLSPYNDFEIIKNIVKEGIGIWSGGLKTEEVFELALNHLQKGLSVTDVYKTVFDSISCEEIGGELKIFHLTSKEKFFINNFPIKEKEQINYLSITSEQKHLVVGERVYGKIIAGVNLIIENDAGKFTFDSNGVRIDGTFLTISKGTNGIELNPDTGITVTKDNVTKTILNATDGLKIQKYELGVWKDKLYTDTNGNLIAEDLVARKLIIRDSGGFTLIDADTKTINFTGFNVITGKDKLLRGVYVTNSSGQITFSVDENGNATMAGNLTINRGLNGSAYVRIDGNGLSAFNGTITSFKIGADGNAEFSGKVTGGQITSNTSINVTTDLRVGNNIYLGEGLSGSKSLIFHNNSRINADGLADIDISANATYIKDGTVYLGNASSGTVYVNGYLNVTGGHNIVAKFG
jgi:hypothetical protein